MNRRRVVCVLVFGFPVVLWMVLLFIGSSESTRYEVSWQWIQKTLIWLSPEISPSLEGRTGLLLNVSMYQVNTAGRRIAHVLSYAILTALMIRLVQQGEARLKRASLITAVVVSILYVGSDELHRHFEPNRHAKWLDVYLNLGGVGLMLTGTVLWFALKAWERRLTADPTPEEGTDLE